MADVVTKPTALAVRPDGIPAALTAERRWVLWRYEWRDKRWAKILCDTSGHHAKSNAPATWTTFASALATYRKGGFDGIGFCLGDGWAGIDFDDCHEIALSFRDRIKCYLEVSPSGTGLKGIGRSHRIGGEIKFSVTPPARTTWRGARFFAITGHGEGDPTIDISDLIDEWFTSRLPAFVQTERPAFDANDVRGTETLGPTDVYEPLTDDEIVERVLTSRQSAKFIRLVRGDVSEYGGDHSRADQALLCILAYWTRRNVDQMDRLFRKSKLMRPKWNVESYRRASLDKAVQL